MKIQKTLLKALIKEAIEKQKNIVKEEVKIFSLEELKKYIKDLEGQSIEFFLPTPNVAGFSETSSQLFKSPEEALKAVEAVKPYKEYNFKLWRDTPGVKHFSVALSPEEQETLTKVVRSGGSLD